MESKEQKERVRREGAKHGVTRQKMMSFKVDLELVEWLSLQSNKGRYINKLIAEDMAKHTPPR